MRNWLLILFLIIVSAGLAPAQTSAIYTATITVTNNPVTGNSLTVNGQTRRWTNNTPALAAMWVVITNSAAGNKTNLFSHLAAAPFNSPFLGLSDGGSNTIILRGFQMVVSSVGNWASITVNTQGGPRLEYLMVPPANYAYATNATNHGNSLVDFISRYATNRVATNAVALAEFVTKGASSGGQTITSPTWIHLLSGNIGRLSNGVISGVLITNTEVYISGGYAQSLYLNGPAMTNGINYGDSFSSPGVGDGSEQFGTGARARGDYSSAFGYFSIATNRAATAVGSFAHASKENALALGAFASAMGLDSTALGVSAAAYHQRATAIGYGAITTASNQVVLGTDIGIGINVSIPGELEVDGGIRDSHFVGSNRVAGMWSWTSANISTLANGNNILSPGSNAFIRLSGGPSAAFSINSILGGFPGRQILLLNDTAQSLTFAHQSGFDPTNINRIMVLGSGSSDFVLGTNGLAFLIYSGDANRWLLGPNTVGTGTGGGGGSGGATGSVSFNNTQFAVSFVTNVSVAQGASFTNIYFYTSLTIDGAKILGGTGSPETVVTAPVGSIFLRTDGAAGTSFYTKTNGALATGWSASAGGGGSGEITYNADAGTTNSTRASWLNGKINNTNYVKTVTAGNGGILVGDQGTNLQLSLNFVVNHSGSGTRLGTFAVNSITLNTLAAVAGITLHSNANLITLSNAIYNTVLSNFVQTGGITNLVNASTNQPALMYSVLALTNNGDARVKTLSDGSNITITDQGTNLLISASGSVGEANVTGEASRTNAFVFGLTASKIGITNFLRSIGPGYGLAGTNESGTNICLAVLPIWQIGSGVLSNLVQTGVITNMVNAFTNPIAGMVGLLALTNNGNARVKGLRAGSNVTLTDEGTNVLIAATGGSGDYVANLTGLGTNLSVYASSATLNPLQVTAKTGSSVDTFQVEDTNGAPVLFVTSNNIVTVSNLAMRAGAVSNRFLRVTNTSGQAEWVELTSPVTKSSLLDYATGDDSTALRGRMDKPYRSFSSAVTNMQSGDTLYVLSGVYSNAAHWTGPTGNDAGFATNTINAKNDISILGVGRPVIFFTNDGNGLVLSNCNNVLIEGLTFWGTRTNITTGSTNQYPTPMGLVTLAGINRNLTFRDCTFTNHMGFGILDRGVNVAYSDVVLVEDCKFLYIGVTNNTVYGFQDGSALNVGGSHWMVRNNFVGWCGRGLEVFAAVGLRQRDVTLMGNSVVSNYSRSIFVDIDAAASSRGIRILNNYLEADTSWRSGASHIGIMVSGATDVLVSGNTITNFGGIGGVGLRVVASSLVDFSDNKILGCGTAILCDQGTTRSRILRNFIRRIEYQGILVNEIIHGEIAGNTVIDVGLTSSANALYIADSFGATTNIIIRQNVLFETAGTGANGIIVNAGVDNTHIQGNHIGGFTTAITDSGTGTHINEFTRIQTNGVDVVHSGALNFITGSNTLVLTTNVSGIVSIQINASASGGGSGTNTLFQTNGVNVTTAGTLNFITGSNTLVLTTNVSGVVAVQINASASGGGGTQNTNGYMPLQIQSGKLPSTNMVKIDASYRDWEMWFSRTNSEGANTPVGATWQFVVPQDYTTNSFGVRLLSTILSTNGPNSSNVIWRASVLRLNPGPSVDIRTNNYGFVATNAVTWTAVFDGTNKVRSTFIALGTNSLLQAGDLAILRIERDNVNDTYVGTSALVGLMAEWAKQ